MKLFQLQLLVGLKKYGSFSKTAEKMYTSQPAISVALRSLEEELGHPICIRTNRGATFTPFGEKVLKQAEIAVSAANQIYHISYQDGAEFCGSLTVASLPHLCNLLLLDIQARIAQAHPDLKLSIERQESQDSLLHVEQAKVNFGLIQRCDVDETWFQKQLDGGKVEYLPLFHDQVFFVCQEGHPLLQLPSVTLEDLVQYPYVTHCKQTSRYAEQLLRGAGYRQPVTEINEFVGLRKYARSHNAISIMPGLAIRHGNMNYQDKFCPLPVRDLDLKTEVGIVYRAQALCEAEQYFLTQLKEACTALAGDL